MKRLLVFPLLVVASIILSACIGTAQATINPNPTAVVPNTGGQIATSNPVIGGGVGTFVPNSGGTLGTPSAPNTGAAVVTPLPTGPTSGDILSTYSPDMFGSTTGGTSVPNPGGVWSADGTIVPPTGGSAATGLPPESMDQNSFATSQAYNATSVPNTGGQIGIATSVPATGGTASPSTNQGQTAQSVRLSSLINFTLNDSNGAVLGQVADFVINSVTTRVDFVVVNANNLQVLVPWSMVGNLDNNARSLSFSDVGTRFNNAPTFDRSSVDFTQQNWNQSVQSYWQSSGTSGSGSTSGTSTPGTSTSAGTGSGTSSTTAGISANANAYLFNQLMQVQIWAMGVNQTGITQNSNIVLGTVQDAIVTVATGDLPYLLVSANLNVQGLQNRLIPIPFKALTRSNNGGNLVLAIDINTFLNAPNFDATGLPSNFASGWDTTILNYWSSLFGGQSTATP